MITRFFIYGLIGWCTEIFWTGLGSLLRGDRKLRGWTYLWMFPIYGMAILLEPIHHLIKEWPILIRGGVYTTAIYLIEYVAGWLLRNTIKICPWDYTQTPYAIHGFIRLDYAPAWFVAGLLFEKIYGLLLTLEI
ncbi:MAG: putative ABC transporter permease [Halanaerobiales bacterium]|nr:putative ABC transporter permease [Halanaerobiales bacterium]